MKNTEMNVKTIIVLVFTILLFIGCSQKPESTIKYKYEALSFSTQYIEGYLGHWIDNAIDDELLKFPLEDYLYSYYTSGITNGIWIPGEFTGKYVHSMCLAYNYKYPKNSWDYRHLLSRMDNILDAWYYFQDKNNGYVGIHMSKAEEPWENLWNVWHEKYVLLGLIKYYETFGDKEALEYAKKLADSFMNEFGPKKRGFDDSELAPVFLESLAMLYKHTGQKKYLDQCYWIMDEQIKPELIDLINNENRLPFKHVYSMQSHLISTLELYEIEGKNQEYLDACIKAVEIMVNSKQFITGGFGTSEFFTTNNVFGATNEDHPQEACTSAHFIYLCRKLFYITGESKYIDYIEKTLYNSTLSSKNPHNGYETSYFCPLQGHKEWKVTDHKNGTPCCSESITRELTCLPEYVWAKSSNNGFAVLLYNQGNFSDTILSKNNQKIPVAVYVETDFPISGNVNIIVSTSSPDVFNVQLRVPDWCTSFIAKIDSTDYKGIPGEFLNIKREWQSSDLIEIVMNMPIVLLKGKSYKNYVAFQRGPQILAVDGFINSDISNLTDLRVDTTKQILLNKVSSNKIPKKWWGKQLYTTHALGNNNVILVPYAEVGQIHESKYYTWIRILDDWNIVDDDDFRYTGKNWSVETTTDGHFGGSAHKTNNEGDFAEYTFNGTGVELYSSSYFNPWSPDKRKCSKMDIYLNSKFYGEFVIKESHLQRQIFSIENLEKGEYTIKLICKDKYVFVDYLRYK